MRAGPGDGLERMTAMPATEFDLVDDPIADAAAADLVYVSDAQPGIRRRRRGRGFSYHVDGTRVTAPATLERIRSLAVPPAWSDVWICRNPDGHLQATGRDARGRKQYRYHPRWREVRDANKFAALHAFGTALPDLRGRVDRDLRKAGMPRDKALALVSCLLDRTLVRVGNKEYADDNESYGLTTLTPEHADVGWNSVSFDFIGKGGVEHHVEIADGRLARLVRRCHELGGQSLFSYRDAETGDVCGVSSTDVNEYLNLTTGLPITAKDFRTWGGTVRATEFLALRGPPSEDDDVDATILEAVDDAAEHLRNTRTVCRNCYLHPTVLDAYRDGSLLHAWNKSRSSARLARAERTVLSLIEDA
jgi:DNA topoisomerase-1